MPPDIPLPIATAACPPIKRQFFTSICSQGRPTRHPSFLAVNGGFHLISSDDILEAAFLHIDEVVMISKDTAYYDDEGRVVRETINRPLSGPWDFLNTYIVNVYPDTTCWVNIHDIGIQEIPWS